MDLRAYFQQKFEEEEGVLAVAVVENPYPYSPLIDGLDVMMLVVSSQCDLHRQTEHVRMDDKHILIRRISPSTLEQWIAGGETRSMIQWLVRGEILMDRDNYLLHIRQRVLAFPVEMRESKQIVEFGCFMRKYYQAKQELQDDNLMDSYSNVLAALHHWAHIVLIEAGIHPELTVWKQTRRFNPGIYKLYEQLTSSNETMEQRIQLVLLACEFSIMSLMKSCCKMLFDVMAEREKPWSMMELQLHPSLEGLQLDLSLLIQKLVKRGYIDEVAVIPDSGDTDAMELCYRNVI
ncbi:nucleotidyltransferase-like protein [Paenibacillus xanthanilyticus]|uniref:Nucleotidyltransferase-like protein n=1 Tax=Paenibacillus xanthanilyticus TaxID=1783531 RepID=A0ABV8K4H4_9BACL